jgi:polyhydroxybutyrate depolymerase
MHPPCRGDDESGSTDSENVGDIVVRTLKRAVLILSGMLALLAITVAVVFALVNETNGEIVSSGEKRRYLLHVPKSYDPGSPTPLVITFHGFAEWPAHQMETGRWNDLADKHGFIVVYPGGTGFPLRWIAYGPTGTTGEPGKDVVFVADLIAALDEEYNIDTERIYANGLSNGGGMSHLLACELADQIAAVGGVAGAYGLPWEACAPSRPVPMIVFHGTGDRIVPYGGEPLSHSGFSLPSIPEWVKTRAGRNGCDDTPVELPLTGEVSGIQYTDCDQDADVVLYTIPGGGHTWPGGEPLPEFITGPTTQDIHASSVMWAFFSQHPMPQ